MSATRKFLATTATLGGLAAAWFAGAAPIWQGFNFHNIQL
jgi:hypothetical protein